MTDIPSRPFTAFNDESLLILANLLADIIPADENEGGMGVIYQTELIALRDTALDEVELRGLQSNEHAFAVECSLDVASCSAAADRGAARGVVPNPQAATHGDNRDALCRRGAGLGKLRHGKVRSWRAIAK